MAENGTESKSPGASSVDDSKKKQGKDLLHHELEKVRKSMQRERMRIKPPQEKEYTPNVHNSLQPFFDTKWFEKFLDSPRVPKHSYVSRKTATTLVDPWESHKMDAYALPDIPRDQKTKASPRRNREDINKDLRKAGSTRLPPWPVVDVRFTGKRKEWTFTDVPHLREVLRNKYTANADDKQKKDYKRTKEDFYRMKLDQLDEVPGDLNRRNLRLAYHAYLKNTPGSRQALIDCLNNLQNGNWQNDDDDASDRDQKTKQSTSAPTNNANQNNNAIHENGHDKDDDGQKPKDDDHDEEEENSEK